jgi:Kef-type K+ transport system membrane component KefB
MTDDMMHCTSALVIFSSLQQQAFVNLLTIGIVIGPTGLKPTSRQAKGWTVDVQSQPQLG